ncbi:MAG: glucuronate isomerase [Spirochaetaceae bacterium]|jgi:glucuronate isomerase|nr:glucuronate isomerase [Spirochaetaceae bacterium]
MKKFIDKDFLLSTESSKRLYHEAAAGEPIFDYHCHLNPQEIAENRHFDNLTDMWLAGDHYKWRAMRANGIDEEYITGKASSEEKFLAWAKTVPYLIGNPLYHWTHLELQRYFDFYEPLNEKSAGEVWKQANEKLKNDKSLSVHGIFERFNVYAVGTTDDPADNLEFHKKAADNAGIKTKVNPSYRPDRALAIEKDDFAEYTALLSKASGKNITTFNDFLSVLASRVEYFDKNGCRASDHDLPVMLFEAASDGSTGALWDKESAAIFDKRISGAAVSAREAESFKSYVLCFLAAEYKKYDWAMQLHIGAMRSINTKALKTLGPNTGYDVIADNKAGFKLARLLDTIESRGSLPKTILYSLNPKDFYVLAAIGGSFQGGIPGKIQLGSAWWFLDNKDGMEAQMKIYANSSVLPRFIGMLTDSRSFLSYPRHEYFRRILCRIIGEWAEAGEIPADFETLGRIVKDISFTNALHYFEKKRASA